MIVRSLFVTLGLLLVWSLVAPRLPRDTDWELPLRTANVERAQDHLYAVPSGEEAVLLGSSLSELLPLDSVAGYPLRSLALSGMGVADGLAVLEYVDRTPAIILVETNLIDKVADDAFQDQVLGTISRKTRYYLPALRQRNQPATALLRTLFYLKNGPPKDQDADELPPRPLNERMLELRREEYAVAPGADEFSLTAGELTQRLEVFRERGSQVVFFELPVHPDLCTTPRALAVRAGLQDILPPAAFTRLPEPDCAAFRTTDGHHLDPESARRFARELEERVNHLTSPR